MPLPTLPSTAREALAGALRGWDRALRTAKGEAEVSLLADDTSVYVGNPKESNKRNPLGNNQLVYQGHRIQDRYTRVSHTLTSQQRTNVI